MVKNFPKILINSIHNVEGIYNKSKVIFKGFLNNDNNSIFLPNKEKNITFPFFQNGKKKHNGFLLEILFHGLNYSSKRIKRKRKKFLIDVHKSEIFIHNENVDSIAKSRIYKRRLVFFSYDISHLNNLGAYIKKLKIPNSYTGKGLFFREDSYRVKKLKKKKKK